MTHELLDHSANLEHSAKQYTTTLLGIIWLLFACWMLYESYDLFGIYMAQKQILFPIYRVAIDSVYQLLIRGIFALIIAIILCSKSTKTIHLITIYLGVLSLSQINYFVAMGRGFFVGIYLLLLISQESSLMLLVLCCGFYEINNLYTVSFGSFRSFINHWGYLDYGFFLVIFSLIVLKTDIQQEGKLSWKAKTAMLFIGFLNYLLGYILPF